MTSSKKNNKKVLYNFLDFFPKIGTNQSVDSHGEF